MKRCRFSRWLAALTLPAFFSSALATSVLAPDFDQLVNSADYIVRATVKSVTCEWRENPSRPGQKYIASLVELDVHEIVKGAPPSPLVLDFVGGQIGDTELVIEGSPKLLVGQESFLFVRGNGRQVVPLVGLGYGHYPVRRDKRTGASPVMRSSGHYLYSAQDVARSESAVVAARSPRAEPLDAAEFSARIRQSIRNPEATRDLRD